MFAALPLSLVTLLLAVVPVSRAAQFNVTVGGPGKLVFDPEFVVRSLSPYAENATDEGFERLERRTRRRCYLHLQTSEPHSFTINIRRSLLHVSGWL